MLAGSHIIYHHEAQSSKKLYVGMQYVFMLLNITSEGICRDSIIPVQSNTVAGIEHQLPRPAAATLITICASKFFLEHHVVPESIL